MLLVIVLLVCGASGGEGWNLNLLHVNDIHVRMEETNQFSAKCSPRDKV